MIILEKICEHTFKTGEITITDPCYDYKIGARYIQNFNVIPGKYYFYAGHNDTISDSDYYNTSFIMIHEGYQLNQDDMQYWDNLHIGVDSGMCGFFENKPDYSSEEWNEICEAFDENDYKLEFKEGVAIQSGWGDGTYFPTEWASVGKGTYALAVQFCFNDEEEYEDYSNVKFIDNTDIPKSGKYWVETTGIYDLHLITQNMDSLQRKKNIIVATILPGDGNSFLYKSDFMKKNFK